MSEQAPPTIAIKEETVDLRDYLRPVWRRKWLILAIVVIAAGGTYFLASRQGSGAQTKQYATSTDVYIEVADPVSLIGASATPTPPDGQQMSDLSTLFTDQATTNAVYQRLGMPVGSAGSVSVGLLNTGAAATLGTSIIVVSTTSSSAELAARLANTYVAEFLASRRQSEAAAASADANATRTQLDSLSNIAANALERQTLRLQLAQQRAVELNPSPGAYQVSPAPVPSAALPAGTFHKPVQDAVLGGVVGLLLGIGLAFGLSLFDRRLRRVSDVESSYGRPVVAVLPHASKPARLLEGRPAVPPEFVETLRSLRINLQLLRNGNPPRTVVVTSAVPGEGKSTVAGNLALVCVESGERVLLIDADLRRPSISEWFGIDTEVGLTQVLRGEESLANAVVAVQRPQGARPTENGSPRPAPTFDPRSRGALDVLVHGDLLGNPAPLLATRAMAATLDAASRHYDVVLIDTAPILAVADTVPMLGTVDAVLLVARLGVTTRDAAERLTEVVERVASAKVLGVVANDVRDTFLDAGYGGLYSGRRSGYGYQNGLVGGSRKRKTTAEAG
jgi:Mrp family chromosome partitioning ATPase